MLAAVMPLPSEEVTPPVTKTYFAMAQPRSRGWARHLRTRRRDATPHSGSQFTPACPYVPQRFTVEGAAKGPIAVRIGTPRPSRFRPSRYSPSHTGSGRLGWRNAA